MRVGIVAGWCAVGGPAGVGDADAGGQGIKHKFAGQVGQFARRAPPVHHAVVDGGNPGAVVAAILKPPEAIDKSIRHRLTRNNADDAAHGYLPFFAC